MNRRPCQSRVGCFLNHQNSQIKIDLFSLSLDIIFSSKNIYRVYIQTIHLYIVYIGVYIYIYIYYTKYLIEHIAALTDNGNRRKRKKTRKQFLDAGPLTSFLETTKIETTTIKTESTPNHISIYHQPYISIISI